MVLGTFLDHNHDGTLYDVPGIQEGHAIFLHSGALLLLLYLAFKGHKHLKILNLGNFQKFEYFSGPKLLELHETLNIKAVFRKVYQRITKYANFWLGIKLQQSDFISRLNMITQREYRTIF